MTMACDVPTNAEQDINDLAVSLRHLLEEQRTAGREGDFARVVRLGELADAVVARIVRQGGEVPATLESLRRDLKGGYDELVLILRAEQVDVQGRLRQLRRVKRTLGVYKTDHRS